MPELRTPMLGQRFWFQYSMEGKHGDELSELWYHSHQECTIVSENEGEPVTDWTREERQESGMPLVYRVQFEDGFEWGVFEDELFNSPEEFDLPRPPSGPPS